MIDLLPAKLQINIGTQHIDNLFWLGKQKQNRPLLIKFTSFFEKSEIMHKKCRLKRTKLIFENDYHPGIRVKRKLLLRHLWEARKAGKFAILIHDKIKIGKTLYKVEDFENSVNQGSLARYQQVE